MLNPMIITGMAVVTCALALYSIAVYYEFKTHTVSKKVLFFFTAGVMLDITSTTFMIIGSRRIPITPHGILGYTALTVMLIDVFLLWRLRLQKGAGEKLPEMLHRYSASAYSWWVLAYIAGGLLVMLVR